MMNAPNPGQHGWIVDGGNINICWNTIPCVPDFLLKNISVLVKRQLVYQVNTHVKQIVLHAQNYAPVYSVRILMTKMNAVIILKWIQTAIAWII